MRVWRQSCTTFSRVAMARFPHRRQSASQKNLAEKEGARLHILPVARLPDWGKLAYERPELLEIEKRHRVRRSGWRASARKARAPIPQRRGRRDSAAAMRCARVHRLRQPDRPRAARRRSVCGALLGVPGPIRAARLRRTEVERGFNGPGGSNLYLTTTSASRPQVGE